MLSLAVMDTVGSSAALNIDGKYIAYPKVSDIDMLLDNNKKLSCGKEDYRLILLNETDKTPLHIACNQADTIDPLIIKRLVEASPDSVMIKNNMEL